MSTILSAAELQRNNISAQRWEEWVVEGQWREWSGGKGYGYNGEGKTCKSGYYYNYRSPGKGVGKGLNNMPEDWYNVGGSEECYDYYSGDWRDQGGEQQLGHFGILAMMSERGGCAGETRTEIEKMSDRDSTHRRTTGERDPLRNTHKAQPIALHNRYQTLHNDDDDDEDTEDEDDEQQQHKHEQTTTDIHTKHKPNT